MTLVQSQRIYWTDYEVPFTGYDINAQTVRLVNSYPVTNWCQGQGRAGGRYVIRLLTNNPNSYLVQLDGIGVTGDRSPVLCV